MILKYISVPIFMISFVVGLFFIYIWGPEKKSVYIYPTLNNYTRTQYKDRASQCFEFTPLPVECPSNLNDINTVPIQE